METFLFDVPEGPKKRTRIEEDLLIRHRKLKSKIEALKVRRQKEEVKYNQSAPTINPNSRKLAEKSEKSLILPVDNLDKAHELLFNSRFFPRKAKISLEELNNSISQPQTSKTRKLENSEVDILMTKSMSDSSIRFPSLRSLRNSSQLSTETLPPDILKRNKLLLNLREEVASRGFNPDPEEPPTQMSIHERSQVWLDKRRKKIKELKDGFESRALDGCTFRPNVSRREVLSLNNTQRSLSVESSYLGLYEKRKMFRSNTKGSEVKTGNSGSRCNNSVSTFNSIRFRESGSGTGSPVYHSLSPVKMNVGHENGYNQEIKETVRLMVDHKNFKLIRRN